MNSTGKPNRRAIRLIALLSVTLFGTFLAPIAVGAATGVAPVITSISPNIVPDSGGKTITIKGTNLVGTTQTDVTISIDGTAVDSNNILMATPTQVVVATPAHADGTVDVTDTTSSGTSAITDADHLRYTGTPIVYSISVPSGSLAGGTSVTVSGANFNGQSTKVYFGSTQAGLSSIGNNSITAISPAHAVGVVDVTVENTTGFSPLVPVDQFTYTGRPVITSIDTTSGPIQGGTEVTVTGENLTTGGTPIFKFGNAVAQLISLYGTTAATIEAPAHTLGTVDITDETGNGSSDATQADRFTYLDLSPIITKVTPNSGPLHGGNTVTIQGENFGGLTGANVLFGQVPSTSYSNTASTITATAPANQPGSYNISVTTPYGTSTASSNSRYIYTNRPVVYSVSPNSGPSRGGNTVTVVGANLISSDANSNIFFGDTQADRHSTDGGSGSVDTTVVTAPAGDVGQVHVIATTSDGISDATDADRYTYLDEAPTITSVSPNSGHSTGGNTVIITGTNFEGPDIGPQVFFGGVAATIQTDSNTSITATAPSHALGVVDISVEAESGTTAVSAADQYTYSDPGPVITSVTPNSGPTAGGNSVTITGTNFEGPDISPEVYFDNVRATLTADSDTFATVTVPAHVAGTVDISIVAEFGTTVTSASDKYTYGVTIPPSAPAVTGLSPASGTTAGGTAVTISGHGFTAATNVQFGGVNTLSYSIESDTSIIARSPAGTGAVDVTVATGYGTSAVTTADQYTYQGQVFIVPTVTSVTPTSGPTAGGTTVVVKGTGFASVTGVSFDGASAFFKSNSDGSISAISPAHSAGVVDVKVTAAGGTSGAASSDHFTYVGSAPPTVSAPHIDSINPNWVSKNGGTTVTVSGSHFDNTTSVAVDGKTVSYKKVDAAHITFVTPAHSPGSVPVVVKTSAGSSNSVTLGYFIQPLPKITSLDPSTVSTKGGQSVTISGQYFTNASSVTVDGIKVSYSVVSDGKITFKTPAHKGAKVTVAVFTPGGSASAPITYK